jgi:nicotinamidase-related amidase
MQEILVVVDMQNDFIDGVLGTAEAAAIVPKVAKKIQSFPGQVLFTRDTHESDYLNTQEGKRLPVTHCVRNTSGWQIHPALDELRSTQPIDKPTFGSTELGAMLQAADGYEPIHRVTLVGVCTDICVISNALLIKAFLPEAEIVVDASCCAGVTPESHQIALQAMQACQIQVIGHP